ncbi:DNA (cytosine-5-)-methyltransferase 3 beta, duplicate a isoform X2 [Nerophis ophidion]|uniref:DNA (cytosine-5-)-methyltransferase 3 beta, duplicate a isoform X2 n=1 Tax=Nerophis ophidion TaxID=159077 RepID=UPI002ADFFB87|nr:DNA (cytosine-5-)-methyltransferase 3 beta, duplicate a isoform X2 [Nerophis ophidion]
MGIKRRSTSRVIVIPKDLPDETDSLNSLTWLNGLLKTNFQDVQHIGSGACHCQMMSGIIPGSIDMTKVRFDAQAKEDCEHNFNLLQYAFTNNNISKTIPVAELINGDCKTNFEFLKWFKSFYTKNVKDEEYDPVKARNSQDIIPYQPSQQSQNGTPKLDHITEDCGVLKVEQLHFNELALKFIKKVCCHQGSRHIADSKLRPEYIKHITTLCKQTPYCIYFYENVPLEKDETVSVVLVGFFDVEGSQHYVKFLDAVNSPADETGEQTASAVVETLKKFGLPKDMLVALYLDHEGSATEPLCLQLRELNPNIVVFGELYNIVDAACHAAMKKLSSPVLELILEIHAHYISCSVKDINLQTLFGSDIIKDGSSSVLNTSCHYVHQTVAKMLEIWTDVTLYFSSCDTKDSKIKFINSQLDDPKVRATFIFLDKTLKPLHKFQTHLQGIKGNSRADIKLISEEASSLLRTYTASFLHPEAAANILKEHNAKILQKKKFHLSSPKLNFGGKAVEDLLENSSACVHFQKEVLLFYVALTEALVQELPLSEEMFGCIAQLLDHQSKLTEKSLEMLVTQLGMCDQMPRQLFSEFLDYQQADGMPQTKDMEHRMDNYWSSILKRTNPISVFRKLVLTLLCLPCPPLDAQLVFRQAFDIGNMPLLSESEAVSQTDSGPMSDCTDNQDNFFKNIPPDLYMRCMQPCQVHLTKLKDLDNLYDDLLEEDCPSEEEDEDSLGKKETRRSLKGSYQDGKGFLTGELVWGKPKGLSWWPGLVISWKTRFSPPGLRKVEWFGDGHFSETPTEDLLPFRAFSTCFCKDSFASLPAYKEAIFQVIELAGERCEKSFEDAKGDKETELKLMVDWAFEGFLPSGPEGFTPSNLQDVEQMDSDSTLSDYQPPVKKKNASKNRPSTSDIIYNRELLDELLNENGTKIEELCLTCGTPDIEVQHPLFEGGLCSRCKENFTETLYRYDEDGYQSYCTVCCSGMEVILCGNTSCCRCFCKDCMDILIAPGTFDKMKVIDPWNCFMCQPEQCTGNLKLRPDWRVKVQDLFANNSAMEFEPHRVYPSIPADERRPLKVLSLFDGIATGYLVLKELGFKIERYIASEICKDSIVVGMVKHEGKIEYVNDVRTITRKHLAEWGPFDLLIGGSPCNDLSMVNPNRKGLFEGTGRLFFEFYRILTLLKPKEDEDRPFFWLFENVVFMSTRDKTDICRFLECNPILIDAVKVSPAHRARLFWGNLPGMNRPLALSLYHKPSLQDCLEPGRTAKLEKIRTITTSSHSHKQRNVGLPVVMNGEEDYLWCTEIEQVFGFPKHYTDVNNMGRSHRRKLLGKSWSVPVVRHFLAPLKDYFECEQ